MHANGEIKRGYPPVPSARGALVGATPLLVTDWHDHMMPRVDGFSTKMHSSTENAAPPKVASPTKKQSAEQVAQQRTDRGHNGGPSGLNWLERLGCSIVMAGPVPQHVAFIMDGNRRFARSHGMEVARGHKIGYDKLEQVLRWCCELGVHGVTVYAFSIDNFKRSQSEVDALMALAEEGLREMSDETHLVQRQGVRVRVVGDLSRVSASLYGEMQRVMRMTLAQMSEGLPDCTGPVLVMIGEALRERLKKL